MHIDATISLGNLIEIGSIVIGGVGVLVTMLTQFGMVKFRLSIVEAKLAWLDEQNVLPIIRRRRQFSQHDGDGR